MLACCGRELFDPLLVPPKFGRHVRRLIANPVQQPVQFRQIDEGEIDPLGPNIGGHGPQIFRFALRGTAHVVRNRAQFQKVENVRPAIHATRLERAFLFREIEQRDVFERDVIEIEVSAKLELHPDKPAQPAPENAAARDRLWQPAERTQRLKRRLAGIVNEVTPVAMFVRPATRKDGGYTRRAVAEDRLEPFAMRRDAAGERVVPDDLPAAGIDEYEQWQNAFHDARLDGNPPRRSVETRRRISPRRRVGLYGLVRIRSAPENSASRLISSSALEVSTMTGILRVAFSRFSRRSAVRPSILGIMASRTSRSGISRRVVSTTSCPSRA